MSADLEETLNELGDDYRKLVIRLRSLPEVDCRHIKRRGINPLFGCASVKMAAASFVLICAVFSVFFLRPFSSEFESPKHQCSIQKTSNPYVRSLCILDGTVLSEILKTQNSDGSWENDYLTRQNAAALRLAGEQGVAYRKAMRYLRRKGLLPLSDKEFAERQSLAAARGLFAIM